MIVIVAQGCSAGFRGDITRWLFEVAPGVYVGNLSARVREELWERMVMHAGRGKIAMAVSTRNEQGFNLRTHNYGWEERDFDGLMLLGRPHPTDDNDAASDETTGRPSTRRWSKARHFRGRGAQRTV